MTSQQARKVYRLLLALFSRSFPSTAAPHRRAKLVISPRRCTFQNHCEHRDLAYAVPGRRARVVILRRALDMHPQNVVGLLLHELGHLFDPTPYLPDAERRADRVALVATGMRVRYDRQMIQTIGRGTGRPRSLHQ